MNYFVLFALSCFLQSPLICASKATADHEKINVIANGNGSALYLSNYFDSTNLLTEKLLYLMNFYSAKTNISSGVSERQLPVYLTNLISDGIKVVNAHLNEPLVVDFICTGCKTIVQSAQFEINSGRTEEQIKTSLQSLLCAFLQILNEDFCTLYLDLIVPPLVYILNNTEISPDVACSMIIPRKCDVPTPPELEWEIPLPPRPTKINPRPQPAPLDGKPVLKVLHLADTHVDLEYMEGTDQECNLPLCCRPPLFDSPKEEKNISMSGMWGGWKCDIPERTLDSLLDFVVNNISDIDHVIWTGDIPSHDLWGQSREKNLDAINRTISKLLTYFPNENEVLPSLGNHEPVPGNLLPPTGVSDERFTNDYLYGALANHWTSKWISVDSKDTINKGAYYKVAYRPGLYMISINSVFCYNSNWWLIYDSQDPDGELAWLVETLTEAELLGYKVHVIAHIPPSSLDCLKVWQRNYYRIVERFQDIIVGQFFGHTHNDEYGLLLDYNNNSKTNGMMFIGPSVTTYTNLNPGFRIYYIDGDHENTTRKVLDYETWTMDLEESNAIGTAVWKKLYSAKEAYGIESMDPEEWRKVYERLKTDDELLQQYHRFYWKDSPKRPEVCDEICKKEYMCGIVSCIQYEGLAPA